MSMADQHVCSTSWNTLINTIGQNDNNLGTLIPYGTEICNLLKGKKKMNGEISYEDVRTAFDDLKVRVNELIEKSKSLEKEKQTAENENKELKSKNNEKEQENKILESQNYKQGVGLGLGIPAAGAAGAGAVIGLPLLVKLLKGIFTRS